MTRFNVYAVIEIEAKDREDARNFAYAVEHDVATSEGEPGVKEIHVQQVEEHDA